MGENVLFALYTPILALALDILLGDPRALPHPVQALGWCAHVLERCARRLPWFTTFGRLYGLLAVALLAGAAGWAAWTLAGLQYLGPLAGLYLAWSGLALGSLLRECHDALRAVEQASLEEARQRVAMLVSRDVSTMDRPALRRTLAETLSENLCDGLTAPFFFLILGGPGALWAYKAVSTLDSMWGYRTPEYARFGWAAARLDDVLAYIPARLTAVFLLTVGAVAGPIGLNRRRILAAVRGTLRDAPAMASPNAGWPMAAAAWACRASMGGPAVYFDALVDKPRLGPASASEDTSWDAARLVTLLRLCFAAGVCGAVALYGLRFALLQG